MAFILERKKTWKYIFRPVLMARNLHKSFCLLFPLPLTLPWQLYRYTVSALLGIWLYWGVELSTFFLFSAVIWETITKQYSIFMVPCPLLEGGHLSSHEGLSKAQSHTNLGNPKGQVKQDLRLPVPFYLQASWCWGTLVKNRREACISLTFLAF